MKRRRFLTRSAVSAGSAALGGWQVSCATRPPKNEKPISMALKWGEVSDPDKVRVGVSLDNRAVYLHEDGQPRFAAAIAIGTPENPTPTGTFRAFNKLPRKRSNTYGFFVKGDRVIPGKHSEMPAGYRYVGYPMPWWVEFKAGYGFHAGAVWPEPRTHGCLRLHRSIADDFFHLVEPGTPIHIAARQPDDAGIGKEIPRPTDYDHPDSPRSVLITEAPFDEPNVYF